MDIFIILRGPESNQWAKKWCRNLTRRKSLLETTRQKDVLKKFSKSKVLRNDVCYPRVADYSEKVWYRFSDYLVNIEMGQNQILCVVQDNMINFNKAIQLNSSAELLLNELFGKQFTINDVARILMSNYSVDYNLAKEDSARWLDNLIAFNVVIKMD